MKHYLYSSSCSIRACWKFEMGDLDSVSGVGQEKSSDDYDNDDNSEQKEYSPEEEVQEGR